MRALARRRLIAGAALGAVAGGAMLVVAGFTTKKEASTYKVALVGPQTGVFAPSTVGFMNSAQQKFDIVPQIATVVTPRLFSTRSSSVPVKPP